jgi:hypothetical protein
MSWVTGTSSVGYLDLLDKFIALATGSGATAISSIVAAGTGYAVDDVITVSGGTGTFPVKIRVLTISGGTITSARIEEGGAYTAAPTNPVAVTGPGNDDATFNLTFASNGWTLRRRTKKAVSATVGAGGSGGTNGTQTVTVVGGVGVTTAAQFSVTVSGGAITAVLSLVTAGLYEEVPTNPVAVTGASLTGATLNVTWTAATTSDQVVILEGAGGGSDEILVGIKTYQVPDVSTFSTCFNWALFAMTAYSSTLTFANQPGI